MEHALPPTVLEILDQKAKEEDWLLVYQSKDYDKGGSLKMSDVVGIRFDVFTDQVRAEVEGRVTVVCKSTLEPRTLFTNYLILVLACIWGYVFWLTMGPVSCVVTCTCFLGYCFYNRSVSAFLLVLSQMALMWLVVINIMERSLAGSSYVWIYDYGRLLASGVAVSIAARFLLQHRKGDPVIVFPFSSSTFFLAWKPPEPLIPIIVSFNQNDIRYMLDLRTEIMKTKLYKPLITKVYVWSKWVEAPLSVTVPAFVYNNLYLRHLTAIGLDLGLPFFLLLQGLFAVIPWLYGHVESIVALVHTDVGVKFCSTLFNVIYSALSWVTHSLGFSVPWWLLDAFERLRYLWTFPANLFSFVSRQLQYISGLLTNHWLRIHFLFTPPSPLYLVVAALTNTFHMATDFFRSFVSFAVAKPLVDVFQFCLFHVRRLAPPGLIRLAYTAFTKFFEVIFKILLVLWPEALTLGAKDLWRFTNSTYQLLQAEGMRSVIRNVFRALADCVRTRVRIAEPYPGANRSRGAFVDGAFPASDAIGSETCMRSDDESEPPASASDEDDATTLMSPPPESSESDFKTPPKPVRRYSDPFPLLRPLSGPRSPSSKTRPTLQAADIAVSIFTSPVLMQRCQSVSAMNSPAAVHRKLVPGESKFSFSVESTKGQETATSNGGRLAGRRRRSPEARPVIPRSRSPSPALAITPANASTGRTTSPSSATGSTNPDRLRGKRSRRKPRESVTMILSPSRSESRLQSCSAVVNGKLVSELVMPLPVAITGPVLIGRKSLSQRRQRELLVSPVNPHSVVASPISGKTILIPASPSTDFLAPPSYTSPAHLSPHSPVFGSPSAIHISPSLPSPLSASGGSKLSISLSSSSSSQHQSAVSSTPSNSAATTMKPESYILTVLPKLASKFNKRLRSPSPLDVVEKKSPAVEEQKDENPFKPFYCVTPRSLTSSSCSAMSSSSVDMVTAMSSNLMATAQFLASALLTARAPGSSPVSDAHVRDTSPTPSVDSIPLTLTLSVSSTALSTSSNPSSFGTDFDAVPPTVAEKAIMPPPPPRHKASLRTHISSSSPVAIIDDSLLMTPIRTRREAKQPLVADNPVSAHFPSPREQRTLLPDTKVPVAADAKLSSKPSMEDPGFFTPKHSAQRVHSRPPDVKAEDAASFPEFFTPKQSVQKLRKRKGRKKGR